MRSWCSPATTRRVWAARATGRGRAAGLSSREAEVLALITQGLTNQQIAARAFVTINSVKSYIRSAYGKIGVTSRTDAVLWGIDNGFRPDTLRTIDPSLLGGRRHGPDTHRGLNEGPKKASTKRTLMPLSGRTRMPMSG